MQPDGETLGRILELRGRTIQGVAERLDVATLTVQRWVSGETAPYPDNRVALAALLDVPLALLIQVVWPDEHLSEEERGVHRRNLLAYVVNGSAAALASQLPGCAPLEVSERVSRLIARFATTDPSAMFAEAKTVLTTLRGVLLSPSLAPGERRRVLADAVDAASVAAWSATLSNQLVDAEAYFDLARKYAKRSGLRLLKAAALASSVRLDRPIAGNDPLATLDKLGVAIPLLGNRTHAKWATVLEAEAYAALNRPRECLEALERAHGMMPFDSGRGFFSSAGMHVDQNADGWHDQWAGLCYAHLGRADDAVMHLERALLGERKLIANPLGIGSDAALAYTIAGEPEAACAHAVEALTGAQGTGYRAGVVRVRQVRARMRPEWAPLSCVQELDERLLLVP